MKIIIFFITLLLLSGNSFAYDPAKVAVVDMQRLIDSSSAANSIKEQAKKERDVYQAEVSKEEEKLRKEEEKLNEQRSILTQDAYNDKRREFNDKLAKIQRDFQERRAKQEEILKKSLDQINQVIFEIIDGLAAEKSFDIAIPTSQILYATKKLDITDQVLESLNKKLPKLNLPNENQNKENSKKK